ncbi:hypothetical protein AgCh_002974 [Apium graveolens]
MLDQLVMKNLKAVIETVLMMKDLETDPQSIPLIKNCIVLKKISDLEMDLKCIPMKKRYLIVRDRIIGPNVRGSATCSHHDCEIGEQIKINYSDLVMKNLEAVFETIIMMKDLETDPQSMNFIKRCMIVLERITDLEMDLKLLPITKRAMIVRTRIIGPSVSGSATCSHHDCRIGEQININAPISLDQQNRACPFVAAFTARCSICSKWRRLPSMEKFEEINEQILELPFVCEYARKWDPEKSCSDDPDLTQDGSMLWAIVRPNIARPPSGWQRVLKFRSSRNTRLADVYYFSPSHKRFRSRVEVQRYLLEHPNEAEGVDLSLFSFQSPEPFCTHFVKKGTDHVASPDGNVDGTLKSSQGACEICAESLSVILAISVERMGE